MIAFKINEVPTLFIKAFTAIDAQNILDFVREAGSLNAHGSNTVLFIDTPITSHTVSTVQKLKKEGYRICYRDHHGIDGEPITERDNQVQLGAAKLLQLLGDDCQITVRRLHPACSTLVSVGEFADAVAIIADPDPDGLTAAMKASGLSYAELDADAALLDGEPYLQVTGSPISQLLAKGMASLPSFDPKDPTGREEAQQELFFNWMKAVQGNKTAEARLQKGVEAYDAAVKVAQDLATTATEVVPGVVLIDCANQPVFDVGTLTALVEQDKNCRISVIRKNLGPIAAIHGMQYSLSVAKLYQQEINLQKILPPQTKSDPHLGVISNVSFILHVSEDNWRDQVVPRLREISEAQWNWS